MIKLVIEFPSEKQKTDPSFVYIGEDGDAAESAMQTALNKSNGGRVELHNLSLPIKQRCAEVQVKKIAKKKAK